MKHRTLFLLVSAISLACGVITPCAFAADGSNAMKQVQAARQKIKELNQTKEVLLENQQKATAQEEEIKPIYEASVKKLEEAESALKIILADTNASDEQRSVTEAAKAKAEIKLHEAKAAMNKAENTSTQIRRRLLDCTHEINLAQQDEYKYLKQAAAEGVPEGLAFIKSPEGIAYVEREEVAAAAIQHARRNDKSMGKQVKGDDEYKYIASKARMNYDTAAKAGNKIKTAYMKAIHKGLHPALALKKAAPQPGILSQEQEIEASIVITKKQYKNINRMFFNPDTDLNNPESVKSLLIGCGISFPKGSSVSYDSEKKVIEMINTEKQHDYMKDLIKKYRGEMDKKEQYASRGVATLQALKFKSGKPNWEADVFVLVCVSKMRLESMLDETSPKEWEAHYKKEGVIKNLQKIQKTKGVTTLYIVEQGADMKLAKQYAKILKIKAPVTQTKGITLDNDTIAEDGISVLDRTGRCRFQGCIDSDTENALTAVEEVLKKNAQE